MSMSGKLGNPGGDEIPHMWYTKPEGRVRRNMLGVEQVTQLPRNRVATAIAIMTHK